MLSLHSNPTCFLHYKHLSMMPHTLITAGSKVFGKTMSRTTRVPVENSKSLGFFCLIYSEKQSSIKKSPLINLEILSFIYVEFGDFSPTTAFCLPFLLPILPGRSQDHLAFYPSTQPARQKQEPKGDYTYLPTYHILKM